MSRVEKFEDLIAWQKSADLVEHIYRFTKDGRVERDRVFTTQIRSAGLSVPSNIAEGFERGSRPDFHRFLTIAKGSCAEVRSDIHIARRLGYLDEETYRILIAQAEEVTRIIAGLRTAVARQKESTRTSLRSPSKRIRKLGPLSPKS